MSYPNIVYGNYGDEKTSQSAKIGGLPLGQLMILPDGRKFRHARAGSATDLEAGAIVSTTATAVGHGGVSGSGLLASATTTENQAGDTDVYLTSKSTVITKNDYAEGMLNVLGPAASSYIGHVYKIKANDSSAVSSKVKFTLYPRDGLKVTAKAATTLHSLRKSPYTDAIVMNAATVIAPVMGGTPSAVTKSHYFWVQRGGECSMQQSATVCVVGEPVMADTALAGSVTLAVAGSATTDTQDNVIIGQCLEGAAASQAVRIDLRIE